MLNMYKRKMLHKYMLSSHTLATVGSEAYKFLPITQLSMTEVLMIMSMTEVLMIMVMTVVLMILIMTEVLMIMIKLMMKL